ncbi:MAG: M24 family metallopeptidase [Patescibacteria group bacterium]
MNINLKQTVKRIMHIVRQSGADCLVIRDLASIRYLTGCAFHSVGDAVVLVRGDRVTLFTDARYLGVKQELAGQPVAIVIWNRLDVPGAIFTAATRGARGARTVVIGFERDSASMTFGFVDQLRTGARKKAWRGKVRVMPIPDLMQLVRSIKTPAEIRLLQKAHRLADEALLVVSRRITVGISEKKIAEWLNIELRRLSGEDELSFATIVASGVNGACAHATPGNRKIRRGDLVTIDFGCTYRGYHSDTTRMIVIGELNPKKQKMFDAVRGAQAAAQTGARPGMSGQEVDAIARNYLKQEGYGDYFIHSTGHGVGLDVHEKPHVTPAAPGINLLEPGMVFSIEPGVYIEGFTGLRLENTVVMTKRGVRSLSRLPMVLKIPA